MIDPDYEEWMYRQDAEYDRLHPEEVKRRDWLSEYIPVMRTFLDESAKAMTEAASMLSYGSDTLDLHNKLLRLANHAKHIVAVTEKVQK